MKKLLVLGGKPIGSCEIVEKAIERKTGARGLRSIIEEIMRDVMFDIPSNYKITKCIITGETVLDKKEPIVEIDENKQKVVHKTIKKEKSYSLLSFSFICSIILSMCSP